MYTHGSLTVDPKDKGVSSTEWFVRKSLLENGVKCFNLRALHFKNVNDKYMRNYVEQT